MKKIILMVCLLLMVQIFANLKVFADEIVDSNGNIIPCKIETVEAGFIEYYHKNGNLCTFTREDNSPIYNDYVDVRDKLFRKDSIIRYSGMIVLKDAWSLVLKNENGNIDIPFYRVKSVGVYKP